MQLTGQESLNEGLVYNVGAAGARRASVDLHVGTIIINGKEYSEAVELKAQQMFILVSRERVKVKAGCVGYAMPKTSLCNDGILCLNTGILDPGYDGMLSTTAINFEEDSYTIAPGEPFLRVVFHRLEGIGASAVETTANRTDSDYLREARSHSRRFPETFLDIPGKVHEISDKVIDRQNGVLLKWIAAITFIFMLWNIAAYVVFGRQASDTSASRAEVELLEQRIRAADIEVKELRAAVCPALSTASQQHRAASSSAIGCP